MYEDKVFLITGGTGSIGRAVVERLLKTNARKVVVFSRDENKQYEMKSEHMDESRLQFVIGDVRDFEAIDTAIRDTKANYVFHAAAMKHVPFCEDFVMEGIKTNVNGSNNVFNACIKNEVEKVVFLSTDKAVEPSCIMGMSKAIAEQILKEKVVNGSKTVFCRTRFGNIMMSRGSVIPLFFKQIRSGESMTITDPDMTRFFMSVDDAVNLVFFAFNNGESGDLFVHKAKSASIGELAKVVSDMCYATSSTKIMGNRGGEKMHEKLLSCSELKHCVDMGHYYRVNDNIDSNGLTESDVSSEFNKMSNEELTSIIQSLV